MKFREFVSFNLTAREYEKSNRGDENYKGVIESLLVGIYPTFFVYFFLKMSNLLRSYTQ